MRRRLALVGILAAALAAAVLVARPPPPPPATTTFDAGDAAAYAAALADPDPDRALRACAALGGTAAGACVAYTAPRLTDAEAARAACDAIASPTWRAECAFIVAEAVTAASGAASGATGCRRAGPLAEACLNHVWRVHALVLLEGASVEDAAAAYAPAYAWGEGVLRDGPRLRERFWHMFFDVLAGQSVRVGGADSTRRRLDRAADLADCDRLGALAEACRLRLPASFRRTLAEAGRDAPLTPKALDTDVLCGPGPLHERITAATGARYVPHPDLDAAAADFAAARCVSPRPPRR